MWTSCTRAVSSLGTTSAWSQSARAGPPSPPSRPTVDDAHRPRGLERPEHVRRTAAGGDAEKDVPRPPQTGQRPREDLVEAVVVAARGDGGGVEGQGDGRPGRPLDLRSQAHQPFRRQMLRIRRAAAIAAEEELARRRASMPRTPRPRPAPAAGLGREAPPQDGAVLHDRRETRGLVHGQLSAVMLLARITRPHFSISRGKEAPAGLRARMPARRSPAPRSSPSRPGRSRRASTLRACGAGSARGVPARPRKAHQVGASKSPKPCCAKVRTPGTCGVRRAW